MTFTVEGVSIPDSKLAREIAKLVRDTETPLLFHHSSRQIMRQLGLLFAAALVLASSAALAQEKYDTAPLPAICTKGAMTAMGGTNTAPPAGAMAMPTDDAHKELAAGMVKMQHAMSAGIQVTDIDIAFNCGMIPHHQGAISMARVELKYGKDPKNRKLAEEIIRGQEKEVMEMLEWLEKRSN
jgi:uncharacterized protein (DUF305 family)